MTETSPRARRVMLGMLHERRHVLERKARLSGVTPEERDVLQELHRRIDDLEEAERAAMPAGLEKPGG